MILNMDHAHLWVKTKVTFICSYMGKKIRTQDFVDEMVGRMHNTARKSWCMPRLQEEWADWNAMKKRNTVKDKNSCCQSYNSVVTLPVSFLFSCGMFGAN